MAPRTTCRAAPAPSWPSMIARAFSLEPTLRVQPQRRRRHRVLLQRYSTRFPLNDAPENMRTYSSVWSDEAVGTGHVRSMLNSAQAWSSQRNSAGQWTQLNARRCCRCCRQAVPAPLMTCPVTWTPAVAVISPRAATARPRTRRTPISRSPSPVPLSRMKATSTSRSKPWVEFDLTGLGNTRTSCNCAGNSLSGDLYWHGGRRSSYHVSSHFGIPDGTSTIHTAWPFPPRLRQHGGCVPSSALSASARTSGTLATSSAPASMSVPLLHECTAPAPMESTRTPATAAMCDGFSVRPAPTATSAPLARGA